MIIVIGTSTQSYVLSVFRHCLRQRTHPNGRVEVEILPDLCQYGFLTVHSMYARCLDTHVGPSCLLLGLDQVMSYA